MNLKQAHAMLVHYGMDPDRATEVLQDVRDSADGYLTLEHPLGFLINITFDVGDYQITTTDPNNIVSHHLERWKKH